MKKTVAIAMSALILAGCGQKPADEAKCGLSTPEIGEFNYIVDRFADMQILRYRVPDIEKLSLKQQEMLYYLSEAALCGRDIIYDQNCRYNLPIRRTLESIYTAEDIDRESPDFKAMETYLKRVWVSNGIHHHYAGDKFRPGFSQEFFENAVRALPAEKLPLKEGQTVDAFLAEITPVIFDPAVMPLHKNQAAGADLLLTSASNYYDGVTQAEAEAFYSAMQDPNDPEPISYGLNSKLVKKDGKLVEETYKVGGLYTEPMEKIVYWLKKALAVAETEPQRAALEKLISFYKSGDLKEFDEYAILWVQDTQSLIDYVCGYTETYGDPLGYKASWEALINFKNLEATKRTETISANAQWFEDNSPTAPEFKKEEVKGVTAKVITAAMLGGDCYPSVPIGINLPNANWIRAAHGSKSVTIENLTEAYAESEAGSGFDEEFCWSPVEVELLKNYLVQTDNLHTDLHECLGHGSGKLLPGVDPNALKEYDATIEEARADLFALYFMADGKMTELGLLPNAEAYKAQYYDYFRNGLLTQLTRIEPGKNIEESHMRNRQLIAKWVLEKSAGDKAVELRQRDGKTFVVINDYLLVQKHLGELLAEIQRIKSTGDYTAAKALVENYAVKVDPQIHNEILERYAKLDLAPYKAFVNPVYTASFDENGQFTGMTIDYTEDFAAQHLRYSRDYSYLK